MPGSHIADCGAPTGTDVWMCASAKNRSECGPKVADFTTEPTQPDHRSNRRVVGEWNANVAPLPARNTRIAAPVLPIGAMRPRPPARLRPGGKKMGRWMRCSASVAPSATTKANCWRGIKDRRGFYMRKVRTMPRSMPRNGRHIKSPPGFL